MSTPANRGKPPRRRIVVIDPRFQWGLVATFAGLTILGNLYLWYVFHRAYSDIRAAGALFGFEPNSAFFIKLAQNESSATMLMVGVSVFAFFLVSAIGILFTHRVLGPIYRLRVHLTDVAEGRTTDDVKFREKDHFKDLESAANRLMAAIRAGKLGK